MNDFEVITRVVFPDSLLLQAYQHFRVRGELGCEGVALWVGRAAGTVFHVSDIVIPAQSGINSDEGLAYVVETQALHRLNVWLHKEDLRMIAQIHSHPGEAYHSETDDLFPIVTTAGGFSLVVPYFGRGLPSLSQCAAYRLGDEGWRKMSHAEVGETFQVV